MIGFISKITNVKLFFVVVVVVGGGVFVLYVLFCLFVFVFFCFFFLQISDFGMARDLEESNYYISHGGKIPVKWTAPEVEIPSVSHLQASVLAPRPPQYCL